MTEQTIKKMEPFILFELGTTIYGIPSCSVQQVEMLEKITPVPNTPSFVEGVVLSRGQVIPVINLRKRFGLQPTIHDTKTRLVVVNMDSRIVGLIVDTAREFLAIPSASIHPPPEKISTLSGQYLQGVAQMRERLILILKIEEILNYTKSEKHPKTEIENVLAN